MVLPPEARALGPLDVVEWTSERHGYEDKQFTVDLIEDLPSGCVALALREIDPSDYDFGDGDLLPTTTGFLGRPPRLPQPTDFGAEGVSLPDGDGTARRPGIKLDWNPSRKADGVRYQLQLLDRPEDLPLLGGHDYSDDDLTPDYLEVFAGEPLEAFEDEPLISAFISDLLQGTAIITAGILPACAYRIRARYVPNGAWCDWIPVTTPDTRISTADLDAALNTRIDDAQSAADGAAADAAQRARDCERRARAGGHPRRRHDRRPRGAARRPRRHRRRRSDGEPATGPAGAAERLEHRSDLPALDRRQPGQVDGDRARLLRRPFAGHYGGGLALDIAVGRDRRYADRELQRRRADDAATRTRPGWCSTRS